MISDSSTHFQQWEDLYSSPDVAPPSDLLKYQQVIYNSHIQALTVLYKANVSRGYTLLLLYHDFSGPGGDTVLQVKPRCWFHFSLPYIIAQCLLAVVIYKK